MTFRSDRATLRTFDPDSGWELFAVPTGRGEPMFDLRHPALGTIHVWARIVSLENTGRVDAIGRFEARIVYKIMSIKHDLPSLATEEERRLVEEALYHYGATHDGPRGPVEFQYYTPD